MEARLILFMENDNVAIAIKTSGLLCSFFYQCSSKKRPFSGWGCLQHSWLVFSSDIEVTPEVLASAGYSAW